MKVSRVRNRVLLLAVASFMAGTALPAHALLAGDAASRVFEKGKEVVNDTKEKARRVVDGAKSTAEEGADAARRLTGQAVDSAIKAAKDAKAALPEVAHKVGAFVGSLGGLTELFEKKCETRGGVVPLSPGAQGGAKLVCPGGAASCPNDVTSRVELVGEPLKKAFPSGEKAFARNIWDLQAFAGKLYIGHGNSNNKGPAANAGPIDVWSFDPRTKRFEKEWTAPDEQLDHFRVVDGALLAPGHDPKESWVKGNFYRKERDGWAKVRTLPLGIHNYDLLGHGGAMFAALGTPTGGVVARSTDGGQSWKSLRQFEAFRIYTLFERGGQLHASGSNGNFFRYDGGKLHEVKGVDFFPGEKLNDGRLRVVRPVSFGGRALYLGACAVIDHNWIPVGLFAAPASSAPTALALPDAARPRDLLVDGGVLYVLASTESGGTHSVRVYATRDLTAWKEVLRFKSETFARSFERLGGDFYFGLGTEAERISEATGRILRVPAEAARLP